MDSKKNRSGWKNPGMGALVEKCVERTRLRWRRLDSSHAAKKEQKSRTITNQ